jgi:XTP/dITP diphosphohydrolase
MFTDYIIIGKIIYMKQIIFATGNKSKIAEMRFVVELFKLPIKVVGGREIYGDKAKYEEIGDTVEQVALNGVLAVAKKIGLPIITEDTDLRIEALNNEPGIRAGEYLKKFGRPGILQRMAGKKNRRAVISSAVAYATPDGASKVFLNKVTGIIADKEAFNGFPDWVSPTAENPFGGGYNAIFIPDGWEKTIAEISPAEAAAWSYREKNFLDAAKYILSLD